MEIRRLTKEDLPALLRLYRQLDASDAALSREEAEAVWEQIYCFFIN